MAGHAKSKAQRQQEAIQDQEEVLEYDINLYRADQEKPKEEQRDLHTICRQAEDKLKKKGRDVTIVHTTLMRQLKGGRSCQQANKENFGWLTTEEDCVVTYCLNLAAQGFPLTHKTLKFHVDSLLHT
ncbi:hypothetical protein F5J12DRAFT_894733 [Pisolithus orientalis]|uniref:uncharacterized protein n=1 Tax=Pisolithus orientalis TaxID=936130 RepID=UPI0022242934|nr:uncharacterized protein F5J12DRAFT_894733 [Pisolithus orientalis]KAI6000283.1 hypothetical protein F5J12DRAFT_894733 [Pisolithus orientalis]